MPQLPLVMAEEIHLEDVFFRFRRINIGLMKSMARLNTEPDLAAYFTAFPAIELLFVLNGVRSGFSTRRSCRFREIAKPPGKWRGRIMSFSRCGGESLMIHSVTTSSILSRLW